MWRLTLPLGSPESRTWQERPRDLVALLCAWWQGKGGGVHGPGWRPSPQSRCISAPVAASGDLTLGDQRPLMSFREPTSSQNLLACFCGMGNFSARIICGLDEISSNQ